MIFLSVVTSANERVSLIHSYTHGLCQDVGPCLIVNLSCFPAVYMNYDDSYRFEARNKILKLNRVIRSSNQSMSAKFLGDVETKSSFCRNVSLLMSVKSYLKHVKRDGHSAGWNLLALREIQMQKYHRHRLHATRRRAPSAPPPVVPL